jgi:hypothetical protein
LGPDSAPIVGIGNAAATTGEEQMEAAKQVPGVIARLQAAGF